MKLIKKKEDNVVILLLKNDSVVDFSEGEMVVDNYYTYTTCNESNCDLVENCGSPEDTLTDADGNPLTFWGNKFIYTDSWALNPDWVEPVKEVVEAPVEEPALE